MNEKTKVIFRVINNDAMSDPILAVFPSLAGDSNPYRTCLSYAHVGQHGSMSIDFMLNTRPAKPEEYVDLKNELESIGYDLQIVKRMSRKDLQARIEQTR